MEIYTRGVDRFFSPQAPPFSYGSGIDRLVGYLAEKVAFNGADDLWVSLQNGISNYSSVYGGQATVNSSVKNRPKAGEALKQLLKQAQSINSEVRDRIAPSDTIIRLENSC